MNLVQNLKDARNLLQRGITTCATLCIDILYRLNFKKLNRLNENNLHIDYVLYGLNCLSYY